MSGDDPRAQATGLVGACYVLLLEGGDIDPVVTDLYALDPNWDQGSHGAYHAHAVW